MKKTIFSILIISLFLSTFAHERDSLYSKSLRFVENKGQWNNNILFKAQLNEGYLLCLPNALHFAFRNQEQFQNLLSYKFKSIKEVINPTPQEYIIDYSAYQVQFENSNKDILVETYDVNSDYENYFLGNDPKYFASNVRNFKKIAYKNIWNGIDMEFFENDHLLKYQFIVEKNHEASQIMLNYVGVENISIQQRNLIIKTTVNQVTELAPVAYQIIEGEKRMIPCKFSLKGKQLSFEFPEGYDNRYDLVIDPVLVFSTYSGSNADNWGFTATYDDNGNTYSGGICFNDYNNGYPVTTGAYQVNFAGGEGSYSGGCDIALIKYNTTGQNRLFATYLGGSKNDLPHSTIVDRNGNLLIFGTTGSPNFPTTANAYDATFNGGISLTYDGVITFNLGVDMYVSKLNSSGTQLLSSTYLGGSNNDGLNFFAPLSHNYADGARGEVNIDKNNNVYIASNTSSTDYPVTAGVFQPGYAGGNNDGCITVLDNNLSHLIWSSYIGGSDMDAAYAVTVTDSSYVYICGGTTSTNFPTRPGAYQPNYNGGECDGFISRISKNGDILLKSTYVGTSYYDQNYLMDKDKKGRIFVFGQTKDPGTNLIYNAAWNQPGGGQFITKFKPDLSGRIWSTTFGTGSGTINISPTALLVDLCSKIYISGWGGGINPGGGGTSGLPISGNAFQNTTDNNDFYLLVIEDDASAMTYGTFFGGSFSQEHVDGGTSRFDRMGKIYQSVCAGCGGNDDFPTSPQAWSIYNNSNNCNNGTFKMDFMLPITIADFTLPPVVCIPTPVNFNNTSHTGGTGLTFLWNFGDGTTSSQQNPSHNYSQSGLYNVTLIASDAGTCNMSDTIIKQVLVLSNSSDSIPKAEICLGGFTQIGILPISDPSITYQWLPATYLSNPTINNPIAHPPSTMTFTLLVSNGYCTDTLRQLVVVHNLQGISLNDTTTCDGHITLTADQGQGIIEFIWSTNHQFTDTLNTSLTNPSFSDSISTPTYFYLRVSNGLCSGIDSVLVTFSVVADSVHHKNVSCNGNCDGMACAFISTGTPPYSFLWNTGSTNDSILNLCAGTYSVTITDHDGCLAQEGVTITEPPPLQATASVLHNPCPQACAGSITLSILGGTPGYTYLWSNGQTTNAVLSLCLGSYGVTITDQENCKLIRSYQIVVDSMFANINVWADKDTIYSGQSVQLHSTFTPTGVYSWQPTQSLDDPTSMNPTATPNQTTTYVLTITDNNGCIHFDSVKVTVLEVLCDEPYIFVPNAFSPDNDGQNDQLYVRGKMIDKVNFLVYDRWGEKVFESSDTKKGWDGHFKGKLCEPGVFVYYLEATCFNKAVYIKKGNITLIR
jgi:gliding motility-associated-like protein